MPIPTRYLVRVNNNCPIEFRPVGNRGFHTVGQSNQECKETFRIKCVSHDKKLELRVLNYEKKSLVQSHISFLGFLLSLQV